MVALNMFFVPQVSRVLFFTNLLCCKELFVISCVLFFCVCLQDFTEMIVHHFATIVLMYFSWVLNFVRIGTIVLATHDAADTWLSVRNLAGHSHVVMFGRAISCRNVRPGDSHVITYGRALSCHNVWPGTLVS